MSERRFKDQITDALSEVLPDASGGVLEKWLAPTTESKIEQIPIDQIRDRSWRADVDTTEPGYRGLKASIRASGVLQPLLLRPHPEGGFEVVSGARRFRAARDTAQATIPAVVRDLDDVQALVGGSWDAVLRLGLTPSESHDMVARLVHAGMEERQAITLVATAPTRAEPEVPADVIVAADDQLTAVATEPVAVGVDGDPFAEIYAEEPQETLAESGEFAPEPAEDDVETPVDTADLLTAISADSIDIAPTDGTSEFVEEPTAADVEAERSADADGGLIPELDAFPDEHGVDESAAALSVVETDELGVTDEPAALAGPIDELAPAEAEYPDAGGEIPAAAELPVDAAPDETAGTDGDGDVAPFAEPAIAATAAEGEYLDANDELLVAAEPVAAAPDESAGIDADADVAAFAEPLDEVAVADTDGEVSGAEPLADAASLAEPTPEPAPSVVADFDFDDDVSGWPAPDHSPADTAPTQPPIPLPLDPTPFPVAASGAGNGVSEPLLAPAATAVAEAPHGDASGNGVALAPVVEATVAVAAVSEPDPPAQTESAPAAPAVSDALTAEPPAAAASAPEVTTTDVPAAVTAPDEASAPVGATPHVIPINLPDAASASAAEEEADLAGSMPVAAPAAEAETESGSRLVASPAIPDAEARPVTARPAAGVPGLLRRGPLFYAVLGIGLAVGAIVFILVSVSEGVGGTTSIIAAVVVAVLGFVTAMVSLAQPRQRR
jgi:hypothetical protein